MVLRDLVRVVEQVGKDKGISKELVLDVVRTAMVTAARKKYGSQNEIEAVINEDNNEVELYLYKRIVDAVKDEYGEISLGDAKTLDDNAQLGEELGVKLDSEEFGRIAAQIVKQVIIQKIRDAEKEIIYNEFKSRQGEIISGICRRIERGNVIVDLGRTEAVMPVKEQITGETFRVGDRVQAYLLEVELSQRGPRIILSRGSDLFLKKLFELEIPEIREGVIEIKGCARSPGVRSKMSVYSKDRDVDPVGACVGMKGARVQNIVNELRGEKIDIVSWHEDITKYVCGAISPAEVMKVVVDEAHKRLEVVVPDDQLSLAIGKKGLNVRLASQLVGWELDVMSESRVSERLAMARKDLLQVVGMTDTIAIALYQYGIDTPAALITHAPETLTQIPGVTLDKARELVGSAKELLDRSQQQVRPESAATGTIKTTGVTIGSQKGVSTMTSTVASKSARTEERNKRFLQLLAEIDAELS